ncbi:hypothetical protein SASPL_152882 [Salvia splendens]|uniref:Ditrans,polycis-polyprenyl diphosphate synthase n=1 Tax=Salvia splendens TaxID=180675 RepID=A0A8X8W3T9_SALSN|nr:hypothetical protein SASPL_152882 [Salvia splendens]
MIFYLVVESILEHVREAMERLFGSSVSYIRRCLFRVLSVGPVPSHLAFILDGNRRYARKWNLGEGMGNRAGFLSLMTIMKYSARFQVRYHLRLQHRQLQEEARRGAGCQDLMLEKIEGLLKEESIINQTSGETRLSNFLLWQTSDSLLYSPRALWPEMGLRHLVWAVLNFQRAQPYLERRKKLM